MAKTFAELRAAQTNVMDELKSKIDKAKGNNTSNRRTLDDTYWTPDHVRGPEGTGYAKLRLLPAPPDGKGGIEPDQFVKYSTFAIKGPGGWYNERSRQHIDNKDPAVAYNISVWQDESLTKDQKIKKIAQRTDKFICGVYVEKDPNKPENEGKVFRWEFGRQVLNIIEEAMFPNTEIDPDKKGIQVFDPENGATLILKIITKNITGKDGKTVAVPSYEKSEFATPAPMFGGDLDKFEDVWKKQYSLQSEVAESKGKSFAELEALFNKAMAFGSNGKQNFLDSDEPIENFRQNKSQEPAQTKKSLAEEMDDEIPFDVEEKKEPVTADAGDDDDWFSSLKS